MTDLFGGGSPPQEFTQDPPKDLGHILKPMAEVRRISTGCMKIEVTGKGPTTEQKPPKVGQVTFGNDYTASISA